MSAQHLRALQGKWPLQAVFSLAAQSERLAMRSNTQLCKTSEGSSHLTLFDGLKTSLWAFALRARAIER